MRETRQAISTVTKVMASRAVVNAEAASSRLSPIRPRMEKVVTWVPDVTKKIAMLRLVMELMKVAVQAETHVGQSRRKWISQRIRRREAPRFAAANAKILIDLSESAAEHLIAEWKVCESERQNHQCCGPSKRGSTKEQQIADTDEDTGNGSREHTKKIDRTANWYRALIDQKGCGHRKESRSKAGSSRVNDTVSKVIGFGKCHWPLVERRCPVHTPGLGECAGNDPEIEAQDKRRNHNADGDECPCDQARQGQARKRAAAA